MNITLFNLTQVSAQAVFDKVAIHLLTQNQKATDNGYCRLHTQGLSCAVGCLIPVDEYYTHMEENNWTDIIDTEHLAHKSMLDDLQLCHDDHEPEHWPTELKQIAHTYSLNTEVINEHLNQHPTNPSSTSRKESERNMS